MSLQFKDREFFISHTTGKVLDQQQRTITTVSSDRGYVNPSAGIYSMPKISSSSTELKTLFAQREDGSEWTARLSNLGLPIRKGHNISLVTLEEKGSPEVAVPVAVVNHDTNQFEHLFHEKRPGVALHHVNAGERLALSMFGGWALTIPAMFAEMWWVAAGLVMFGPLMVAYAIDGDRRALMESYVAELNTHIDQLLKQGPIPRRAPLHT